VDPETQKKIDDIWAILNATAAQAKEYDRRFQRDMEAAKRRMDAAERRMDAAERRMDAFDRRMEASDRRFEKRMQAADERFRQRMEAADQRMDKFDKQLQVTRKLVQAGIKLVSTLAADTRELKRSQKAFLDSFRNGSNGNRHRS
jgi:hypothetical protein